MERITIFGICYSENFARDEKYQENNAILVHSDSQDLLQRIADRENCHLRIVRNDTPKENVVVVDSKLDETVVDLPSSCVLGEMPQKTFYDEKVQVVRLLSVGSKQFLVNKVERSVTGLIAQMS